MLGFKEIPHLGTKEKNVLGGQIESLTSELLTNTVVVTKTNPTVTVLPVLCRDCYVLLCQT